MNSVLHVRYGQQCLRRASQMPSLYEGPSNASLSQATNKGLLYFDNRCLFSLRTSAMSGFAKELPLPSFIFLRNAVTRLMSIWTTSRVRKPLLQHLTLFASSTLHLTASVCKLQLTPFKFASHIPEFAPHLTKVDRVRPTIELDCHCTLYSPQLCSLEKPRWRTLELDDRSKLQPLAFFTWRPYCPRRLKKLCLCILSLVLKCFTARLSMHKQLF